MKVEKIREKSQLPGWLLSIGVFAAMIGIFGASVLSFGEKTGSREEETLRRAVTRASVQCYAIEGRYPPSVEYLEEHYGIRIDREKFHVFYNGFASNVMPEITIIPAGEQEDGS